MSKLLSFSEKPGTWQSQGGPMRSFVLKMDDGPAVLNVKEDNFERRKAQLLALTGQECPFTFQPGTGTFPRKATWPQGFQPGAEAATAAPAAPAPRTGHMANERSINRRKALEEAIKLRAHPAYADASTLEVAEELFSWLEGV